MITRDVQVAAAALRSGGLVAIPTETVYGLAADATNANALARLYAVKGRPLDHPSIIHLADLESVQVGWVGNWPATADLLARAFWPGPLTLILSAGDRPDPAALGGTGTVAVRVPDSRIARELIELAGTGVAAPSANRFGRVSPTTAQHVLDDLGEDVDVILDAGPCPVGVESTIVDLTGWAPRILRPGAITAAMLEQALGQKLAQSIEGAPRAPGTLAAHYSPRTPLRLVADITSALADQSTTIALIAPDAGHLQGGQPGHVVAVLDAGPDAATYAERLYALLRAADNCGAEKIVAVAPAAGGLGDAVRDRLNRAAVGG